MYSYPIWLISKILSWSNWWPLFVIIFYVLCPIPLAIGRRCTSDSGYGTSDSSPCTDLMWFITSVLVVSAFGLPAILYRAGVVSSTKIFEWNFICKFRFMLVQWVLSWQQMWLSLQRLWSILWHLDLMIVYLVIKERRWRTNLIFV
jgi:hypothetical protein